MSLWNKITGKSNKYVHPLFQFDASYTKAQIEKRLDRGSVKTAGERLTGLYKEKGHEDVTYSFRKSGNHWCFSTFAPRDFLRWIERK